MDINFKEKVVLVTGGTRGIGEAIADVFERSGAQLILTGTGPEQVAELNHHYSGKNRTYHVLDLSQQDSVENFLKNMDWYERIDVCVNNAGINIIQELVDTRPSDYDRLMAINLKGPYLLNQYCADRMKKTGWGRVVNICSIWSKIARPGRSLYTMAKNGLHGLTQAMAVELSRHNILVNSVSPGFTLTDLTRQTNTEEELRKIADSIPANRMSLPEEIANVVVFLSSEQNSYLTGQNIVVDGGYTIV